MAETAISLFFQCEICEKLFLNYSDLTSHWKIHTEVPELPEIITRKESDTGCSNTKKELSKKPKILDKSFICGVCEKAFSRKGCLKIHMTIHTGEKNHQCSECGKSFSHKIILQRHYMVHSGEKPFKCDICDTAFSKKSSMQRHKRVHSGEKPYECDVCGKMFTQSGNLNKHIKTHDKEYRYICNFCGKAFSRNVNMKRHMKKMHSQEVTQSGADGISEAGNQLSKPHTDLEDIYKIQNELLKTCEVESQHQTDKCDDNNIDKNELSVKDCKQEIQRDNNETQKTDMHNSKIATNETRNNQIEQPDNQKEKFCCDVNEANTKTFQASKPFTEESCSSNTTEIVLSNQNLKN